MERDTIVEEAEEEIMTMRTESIAPAEIEEYNREKAQMRE